MPMARNRETTLYMLNALETPNRELTKWEENFLDSLRERALQRPKWYASEREFEILENLYAEKTA